MTNNLKILVILSIFVFILTGYFCFSSSFTKNQIITNNNDEEKKDGKKTTIDTNNKDNNNNEKKKDNEEKASERLILNITILIVLFIITIVVIVFIIVNKFKFEFNEESKEDFKKENFCPTFFLISVLANEKGIIGDFKENGDYFFEILAKYILSRNIPKDNINNINEVEIYLGDDYNDYIDNDTYIISLDTILYEISTFAAFSKNVSNKKVNEIASSYSEGINMDELHTTSKHIENKYGGKFDSYLCSYLLYHLAKEIGKKNKKVKTHIHHKGGNHKKTYNTSFADDDNNILFTKEYNIDLRIMDKILEKIALKINH